MGVLKEEKVKDGKGEGLMGQGIVLEEEAFVFSCNEVCNAKYQKQSRRGRRLAHAKKG